MVLNLNNCNIDSMPNLDAYLFSMWKAKAVRAFFKGDKKNSLRLCLMFTLFFEKFCFDNVCRSKMIHFFKELMKLIESKGHKGLKEKKREKRKN